MGKTSAAVKNRYNAKAYDRIVLAVPKGKKEIWQAHAANRGMSLTKLITTLVEKDMSKT